MLHEHAAAFRFVLALAPTLLIGCAPGGDSSFAANSIRGSGCAVDFQITNQWQGGFNAALTVTNQGAAVDGWTLTWSFADGETIQNLWNGVASQSGAAVKVTNASWNGHLGAGAMLSGLGFTANGSGATVPTDFALDGVRCNAPTPPPPSPPPPPPSNPPPAGGTPVARHGRLHVCGTQLCDEHDQVTQLRGVSTHGLQWYGWNSTCLNASALDAMANTWHADVVRLADYVQEGGWETNPSGFDAMIDTLIDETGKRGMYVLVDWHILNPGDPNYNLDRARQFFSYMAQKHGNDPHVLFELANEPNGVDWAAIQGYAQEILDIIRNQYGSQAVAIIGTPDWSSYGHSGGHSPDDIVANPPRGSDGRPYSNVMYTFHFYAASHGDDYRAVVSTYSSKVPIFVTEWGAPTYTGDGAIDEASVHAWQALLDSKQISSVYWNWSDNGQSGSLFRPGTCSRGTWSGDVLQRSGQLVLAYLTNR